MKTKESGMKLFLILLSLFVTSQSELIISDSLQYYFAKAMQSHLNYGSENDSISLRFLSESTELAVIKTGDFQNPVDGVIKAEPVASEGLATGTPTIWELINKDAILVLTDSIGNGVDFTGSITDGVALAVPDSIIVTVPYSTGVVTPPLPPDTVDVVTFDPDGGVYNDTQSVSLSTDTTGTTIHYHLSGTTTFSTYSTAVEIAETDSIYAYASKSGLANSDTTFEVYTITNNTVTYGVLGGTYDTSQYVSLTPANSGDTVYYRFAPTAAWCRYTTNYPLALHQSCVLYAYASSSISDINQQEYNINYIPDSGIVWTQVNDIQQIKYEIMPDSIVTIRVTWWDGSVDTNTITGTGGEQYVYKMNAGTNPRTNTIVFSKPSVVLVIGQAVTGTQSILIDHSTFTSLYRISLFNTADLVDVNLFGATSLYSLYFDGLTGFPLQTMDRVFAELDACASYGSSGRAVVGGSSHTSASNLVCASLTTKSWTGFTQQ